MKIGIISGSNFQDFVNHSDRIIIETKFGKVTVNLSKMNKHDIFFINRHGKNSNIPPHKINYHGNIQAFSSCHVDSIISLGSVGSMNKNIRQGDFVIPHDFIDFTKLRNQSFFDDTRIHIDMTNPFCPSIRELLIKKCKYIKNIKLHDNGVYLTTEGPRLESASEIKLFSRYADIVGMTMVPEVILAREKGICYTSLTLVCNMAAGLKSKLTAKEINTILHDKEPDILKILESTIPLIQEERDCKCRKSILEASI